MRDFTLEAYKSYITALKESGASFIRFDQFIGAQDQYQNFVLLRHDVDRKPQNALVMARLEQDLGVQSTYYFRMRTSTFEERIIMAIAEIGHEIGYHYECLSDTNGDFDKAYELFEKNLRKFRRVTDVKTISMHGSPLKPYDNRDLWRDKEKHAYLTNELGVTGEVYLDIDYSDIAYVNDTGRNWTAEKANRRDQVGSNVIADFTSSEQLQSYMKNPHRKMIFQVHPERWVDHELGWIVQYLKDKSVNMIKAMLSGIGR